MLPFISRFHVEMFDPCFSDVHCPVEFTFSIDVHASPDYVPDMGTFHCGNEISDSVE